jgi:uncharacterized membrane protein YoaK (UPF0700 family)
METKNVQMSESFLIGMLLAIAGGFLDAYTYILRGHVFANAQTGNIVLLAIKLSESNYKEAGLYLIPVIAFVVGILIAEFIRRNMAEIHWIHWRQAVVALEFCIVLLVAFIPDGLMNSVVNVLISFVCSMQVECFRKVNGNAYATKMCTGNLRSASEQLYRYAVFKDKSAINKSMQYFGITLFFIIGAYFGSIIINIYHEASALFCCLLLLAVFVLMFKRKKAVIK